MLTLSQGLVWIAVAAGAFLLLGQVMHLTLKSLDDPETTLGGRLAFKETRSRAAGGGGIDEGGDGGDGGGGD